MRVVTHGGLSALSWKEILGMVEGVSRYGSVMVTVTCM
jgi:hypothetical protein